MRTKTVFLIFTVIAGFLFMLALPNAESTDNWEKVTVNDFNFKDCRYYGVKGSNGCEVWRTSGGTTLEQVNSNGFGDSDNDDLVAYYPFNGNANDESGNLNDGTVDGATLTEDRFGNSDSAYIFDGNDKITIPNHSSLNPSYITVACWVQFDRLAYGNGYSGTQAQFPICKGGDRTSGAYRFIQSGSSSTSHWMSFSIGEFWQGWDAATTIALDTDRWYHLAGTYDGQTIRLYLDGVLVGSKDIGSIPVGNSSPLYLSYDDVVGYPYYLDGILDDIRIYSRALSEAEIQELYNTPTCTDNDGDGYGSPASTLCDHPELDCNDNNVSVNPGATEVCGDGIDNDCDGAIDEGCYTCSNDIDAFCDENIIANCHFLNMTNETAWQKNGINIVDQNGNINNSWWGNYPNSFLWGTWADAWVEQEINIPPSAESICINVCRNCWDGNDQYNVRLSIMLNGNYIANNVVPPSGTNSVKFDIPEQYKGYSTSLRIQIVGNSFTYSNLFINWVNILLSPSIIDTDNDGDGYYESYDCDDNNAAINPGAAEACNDNKDNDCDGLIDEGCSTCTDNDGDGYGSSASNTCTHPELDCDDNDPHVNPGASEICFDLADNDCDGSVDEGCIGKNIAADFEGCGDFNDTPAYVQFYDTSIGDIVSWEWVFGDGGTSYEQDPLHTYQREGVFTVSLTVTGANGETDKVIKSGCVRVGDCTLDADFIASPTYGDAPLTVQFTDQSLGPVTEYSWSFGDGGTSDDQNPFHTYNNPGTYTVTLSVSGPGCTDIESKVNLITVQEQGDTIPVGTCAIELATFGRSNAKANADLLRSFRDNILSSSISGKMLTRLYYYHTEEIVKILSEDDELKTKLGDMVEVFTPGVRKIISGGSAIVTKEELEQIKGILVALADRGSVALKITMHFILDKIENESLLQQYGIFVLEEK